jgi:hypothetical protein
MRGVVAGLAVLLALGVFFFRYAVPSPTPSAEMTQEEIAQIEEAVKQAATDQMNTWIAQEDMDAFVADHSGWAGNPWNGARTLEGMRERQAGFWDQYDWAVLDPPEWEVRILGPEAAAVKGTLEMTRTDTVGVVQHYYADWAEVWVIEDGRWRLLVARENTERID